MTIPENISINKEVEIARVELVFRYDRSSGPGGQNVNKLNTKVTLVFNVAGSESLSAYQKKRITDRLSSRINKAGEIMVVSQKSRSQSANKEDAVGRLAVLLAGALKVQKARRKTKPTRASKERRLKAKKQRSEIKKDRSRTAFRQGDS
ncbi:MAG: aminoacyl-tRNA hydrolase [Planctomycetes bacterium]|nr:aminoacyl-tRNA hydrolase [Planctomycetota bacterium]